MLEHVADEHEVEALRDACAIGLGLDVPDDHLAVANGLGRRGRVVLEAGDHASLLLQERCDVAGGAADVEHPRPRRDLREQPPMAAAEPVRLDEAPVRSRLGSRRTRPARETLGRAGDLRIDNRGLVGPGRRRHCGQATSAEGLKTKARREERAFGGSGRGYVTRIGIGGRGL